MDEKIDYTTIKITKITRDTLKKLRHFRRETHDEVVHRLIMYYLENKAKEQYQEE